MQPRGRLDISLRRLIGAALPQFAGDADSLIREIGDLWGDADRTLVALSVRSAFDAALATLDWPTGSLILMSAINIADMAKIVTERGFRIVPLAVDPETLAPDPHTVIDTIERLRAEPGTPPIRALLLTHLFGSRIDLAPFAEIAARYGIQLWEDAAQAFAVETRDANGTCQLESTPHPAVDLSLTSFGLIKTHTTLGGGITVFRDTNWCRRAFSLTQTWPRQPENEFLRRGVLRGIALSVLTRPIPFTIVANGIALLGGDLDQLLSGATRGFSSGDLWPRIRRQPAFRLLKLLRDRLFHPEPNGAQRRANLADLYRTRLPPEVLIGRKARFPTTWVFPIQVPEPDHLQLQLAKKGFDATRRASRLVNLSAPPGMTPTSEIWLENLLYLPLHTHLSERHVRDIVREVAETLESPLD